jgi:hypothetical protein
MTERDLGGVHFVMFADEPEPEPEPEPEEEAPPSPPGRLTRHI